MTIEYSEVETILNDVFVITGGRFKTTNEFSEYVTSKVFTNGTTHMDEVISFCTEFDVEIENIKPIVNQTLKERLYADAVQGNMIKSQKPVVALPF